MTIAEKLTTIAENEPKVYDAGRTLGIEEGRTLGIEQGRALGIEEGKKTEYDAFWDSFQRNGTNQDTRNMFSGFGWTKDTLKPKYSVVAKSTYMMFAYCGYNGDLADVFDKRGLTLKFELDPYNYQQGMLFFNSNVTAVGEVDLSPLNDKAQISSMFNTTKLTTIRKLIPPQCPLEKNCWGSGLINLGIGGDIVNTFDLTKCTKLSQDSIDSVMSWLSPDVSGKTVTFSKTAAVSAYGSEENAVVYLESAKPTGWNVSLA